VFAFGRAHDLSVRVRFDGEDWKDIQAVPTPIPPGGRDYFWVAPAQGDCPAFTVQGLDIDGNVVVEQRVGSPDSYAACRSG
jgi:hypothetical protein